MQQKNAKRFDNNKKSTIFAPVLECVHAQKAFRHIFEALNLVDYLKEMPMEYERNCYFTSLKPSPPDSGG